MIRELYFGTNLSSWATNCGFGAKLGSLIGELQLRISASLISHGN